MRLKVISGDGIAVEIPFPAEDGSAVLERAEELYRSGNEQECRRILIAFAAPLFPEQCRDRVEKITTADAFKLFAALLSEKTVSRTAKLCSHPDEAEKTGSCLEPPNSKTDQWKNMFARIKNIFLRKNTCRIRNCKYRMQDVEDILPVAYAFKWSLEYTLSLPEEILEKCRSFTGDASRNKDEILPELPEEDVNAAAARALKKLESIRKSTTSGRSKERQIDQ